LATGCLNFLFVFKKLIQFSSFVTKKEANSDLDNFKENSAKPEEIKNEPKIEKKDSLKVIEEIEPDSPLHEEIPEK
jgi:hypothetical protein